MELLEIMKKNRVTLYNAIFPVWLLWLFPQTWIVILPANFLIDLLVIVLTMRHLGIREIRSRVKKVILRTWLCGFAADFVGVFLMFVTELINFDRNTAFGRWWDDKLADPVMFHPFSSVWGFLWVTLCVLVSAAVIYLLNVKFCLKKADLEEYERKKLALSLAVFTAPYLFYLPTKWFYYW